MNKLLLLIVCMFPLSLMAQGTGISYQNEKIGNSRVSGKRVGNIVGAYLTIGLSAANSNIVIEGENSDCVIDNSKPEFTFTFGEDKQTEYIFADSSNLDAIVLIKLHEKKGSRYLRTGKYGLIAGVQTGTDQKDVQPISVEKVDDKHFKVTPKSRLAKGQYAFYYIGTVPDGKNRYNGVFDFSIK